MDLYMEILAKALLRGEVQVVFPNLDRSADGLVELRCYEAIQKIKAVLENPDLEDESCFQRIEAIMTTLEDMTDGIANRHDF